MMGQVGSKMLGDMPSRAPGGCKIGQFPDLEVLRKADPTLGMEAVARHGRTLMARDLSLNNQEWPEVRQRQSVNFSFVCLFLLRLT
jgi:hypothetical protein